MFRRRRDRSPPENVVSPETGWFRQQNMNRSRRSRSSEGAPAVLQRPRSDPPPPSSPQPQRPPPGDPLPPGWEERIANDGRHYFVDHNTQSTTWTRPFHAPPRLQQRMQATALPAGWEERRTPRGRPMFVHSDTGVVSFDRPQGFLPPNRSPIRPPPLPSRSAFGSPQTPPRANPSLQIPGAWTPNMQGPRTPGGTMRRRRSQPDFLNFILGMANSALTPPGSATAHRRFASAATASSPNLIPELADALDEANLQQALSLSMQDDTPRYERDFDLKLHYLRSQPELRSIPGNCEIFVRRPHLMEDAFDQLVRKSASELRKTLRISFAGEDGLDFGGVSRYVNACAFRDCGLISAAANSFTYSRTNSSIRRIVYSNILPTTTILFKSTRPVGSILNISSTSSSRGD